MMPLVPRPTSVTARRWTALRRGLIALGLAVAALAGFGAWNYWQEATAPPFDPTATELRAVEVGQGPRRMVLVHGLAGSGRYWVDRVAPLLGDHTLLIPDLLGFGESPKPRARYGLDDHLAALEHLLRQRGFDRGDGWLVGHSLGAVVALGLVSRRPAWFQGAVLIGLPLYRDEADALARLGRRSWLFRQMLAGSPSLRVAHYLRALYAWPWLAAWVGLPEDVYTDSMRHTWGSLSGTLHETILGTDATALMRTVATPVLFIHGQDDQVAPLAAARALAATRPNARFVALPGADHQVLLREPERVWALVRSFERDIRP